MLKKIEGQKDESIGDGVGDRYRRQRSTWRIRLKIL